MAEDGVPRLLVLDDERIIADTVCMIANQSGVEARAAYNPESAIAIAHEFRPEIFITGFCNGPGENGCETAAMVLTFLPECRIAIFSGSQYAAPVLQDFFDRGYEFDILPKPIHPQQFIEWLKAHGARAGEPTERSDFRTDRGYGRRALGGWRKWFAGRWLR